MRLKGNILNNFFVPFEYFVVNGLIIIFINEGEITSLVFESGKFGNDHKTRGPVLAVLYKT